MNNSKNMRLASILEIVVGVLSIVMIQTLLKSNVNVDVTEAQATKALGDIVLMYGADCFKILAGIIGLLMASKKSLLTVVLGLLLFVAQLWSFYQSMNVMVVMIINIILLVIPYLYFSSAYKNFKA